MSFPRIFPRRAGSHKASSVGRSYNRYLCLKNFPWCYRNVIMS